MDIYLVDGDQETLTMAFWRFFFRYLLGGSFQLDPVVRITPIYKAVKRPGNLLTMVINHLLTGMILQVCLKEIYFNNHSDRFRSLRIGLFPFQMAELHGL